MGILKEVPIGIGERVVPVYSLVLEEIPYDILIDLPTMTQLQACPDYYCTVLKIHYGGDSEILNYEYERYSANTFEDEFKQCRRSIVGRKSNASEYEGCQSGQ